MFTAGLENPDQIAADLFPRQATANRAIFFAGGQARTIREVYRALVSKHEGAAATSFATQQMAGESAETAAQVALPPIPSRFSPENMSFTGLFKTEVETGDEPVDGAFFTQLYSK
jgi:hypothetical protein